MTTPNTTTTDWDRVTELAKSGRSPNAVAMLELLVRVQALETNSQPTPNDRQIRNTDHIGDINKMVHSSAGLKSSLLERVRNAIANQYEPNDYCWDEARAAIREVATWLRFTNLWEAADMLEQEAEG